MTSSNQSKGGFGPIALIVAGVVCFAAGYMVNDLTKAFTQNVPEPKPGAFTKPPMPDERDAQPTETPPEGDPKPEDKPEEKPAPASQPPAGAGAPPPKP